MNCLFVHMRAALCLLVSIAFASLAFSGCKDTPNYPEYRGERGESCESRNDCKKGLACLSNTCVVHEVPFSATASECVVIECTASSDCCPEKPDFLELDCSKDREALQTEYDTCVNEECDGNTWACAPCEEELARLNSFDRNLFNAYCACNKTCDDNRCEDVPVEPEPPVDECEDQDDGTLCSWGSGVCHDGQCVSCSTDQHCQERNLHGDPMSWSCNADNFCEQACYNDSNCGKYHACEDGTCVETDGCTSDRECAFNTRDTTAFCNKDTGKCERECATSYDCNYGLTDGEWEAYTCDEGICVFVGCESDEECQARNNYSPTQRHAEYLCRPIAE